MSKLVSAIITTHNRFALFKKALDSVKNQTYKNIEIIVVTGNDNEALKLYMQKHPDIIYITSQNSHPNVLRNLGTERASGKFIAFLDDDDTWMNNKIALQMECFQLNNIALCYTGKNIINKNNQHIKYSYHKPKFKSYAKSIMWDNFIGTTSSIMVCKDALIDAECFDEDFPALQDYDLYIRICQKYNVMGINKPLMNYLNNHSKNQLSQNIKNFQIACELLKIKYKNVPYSSILFISLTKIKIKKKIKELYE